MVQDFSKVIIEERIDRSIFDASMVRSAIWAEDKDLKNMFNKLSPNSAQQKSSVPSEWISKG